MSPVKGPLNGIRVLDCATFLAAPLAASTLSEFGAEVIKVEQPGTGDSLRQFGTPTDIDDSLVWLSEARNKSSLTLNLRDPEGADLFRQLYLATMALSLVDSLVVERFGWFRPRRPAA